jgi:hypothetical protein
MGIALGLAAAAFATCASAQYYDRYSGDRYGQRIDGDQECWNPHAGHYERVRPGDQQNDLDFRRCRLVNGAPAYVEPAPAYIERAPAYVDRAPAYVDRAPAYVERAPMARAGDECWNPHAGHFEAVRPNERQDDLDFSRCRPMGYGYGTRYR